MKLYHNTLFDNSESIELNGIALNLAKASRDEKVSTDLFNMVFNEEHGIYLPEGVKSQVDLPIDRNSAIFLAAFPHEFRKSEHLGGSLNLGGEESDICYVVDIKKDLPAFDMSLYDLFAEGLTNKLNKTIAGTFYRAGGDDELELRARQLALYGFFVDGNSDRLNEFGKLPDELKNKFEGLREKVLGYTSNHVCNYCENAVTAQDVVDDYKSMNNSGSAVWELSNTSKSKEGLPERIDKLEILCSEPISKERIGRIE